eukprot:gnl/MRDRNA2_/MRDRNA2_19356_c0_seq1.p1 gnl/MRDRNA2_/MRDRNA2_19356_c0~~gnl/MRDRNA2_/MRDRNA2_19356_c0_seq1.p1  ORF type:complete len:343 (-),score=77.56 gnl/MRDRNA2_/MRDRNA2_19356_c0_seq1:6-1034(-)
MMWRPGLTLVVGLICVVGLYMTLSSSGVSAPPAPNQSKIGSHIESKLGIIGRIVKAALSEFNICPNLRKAVINAEKHIENDILTVLESADACAENTQSKGCARLLQQKVENILMKEMELTMVSKDEDEETHHLKRLFVRLTALMASPFIKNLQKELPAKPEAAVEKLGDKLENKLSAQLEKFCPSTEEKWEDLSDSGLQEILEKNEVSDDMKATLTRLWLHNAHAHHQEQELRSAVLELAQNTVTHEQLSEVQAYEFGNHVAHEKQCFILLWCAFFALAALFTIDKARHHRSADQVDDSDDETAHASGAFAANPRTFCMNSSSARVDYEHIENPRQLSTTMV